VLVSLGGVTVAAWVYVVLSARRMASESPDMMDDSMAPMMGAMTRVQPWTATEFGLRLAMWAVMMVAMMLPTAAPMTLLYAAVARKAAAPHPLASTSAFVTGYIAMWTIFSLVATLAQRALDQAALLSPMMVSTSAVFGAALLIAAGVYQLTPLKNACLKNCCWILMGLLFVGGVMNLLWIAAIAIFVLLEKTIPFGEVGGRIAGVAMILVGAVSLAL
jgi:predicted metal-binding membrane protein